MAVCPVATRATAARPSSNYVSLLPQAGSGRRRYGRPCTSVSPLGCHRVIIRRCETACDAFAGATYSAAPGEQTSAPTRRLLHTIVARFYPSVIKQTLTRS